VLVFNVWDAIVHNEFAQVVTDAVAQMHPQDPPRFLARIPHGWHDPHAIARALEEGGFTVAPDIGIVPARSKAASPRIPALAYCQGTPLRSEIEARGLDLAAATEVATQAVAQRFGSGAVDGRIQALVVTVRR
jgi:hypothetical protein